VPLNDTSKVEDAILKRKHVKQKKNWRNIEHKVINPSKPWNIPAKN